MNMRLTPKVMLPCLTLGQKASMSAFSRERAGGSRALRFTRVLGLAAVLGMLVAASASADSVIWNHASGDRNWPTSGNWTGGTPASTNDIIFNNTDAQTTNTPV